jgi:cystathionine beta-synthase
MRSAQNILDEIGNTSMIRLNRIAAGVPSEIYAKLEMMNPMGSVKDRIARHMVEKAEREGRIKPGDTIVDNSSGNTALGLAWSAGSRATSSRWSSGTARASKRSSFSRP